MIRNKYKSITVSVLSSLLLMLALFLFLNDTPTSVRAGGGPLFVSPDGSGNACSQATPCELQTALNNAAANHTIYLAQGTYTSTGSEVMQIAKNLFIYGGWDGAASGPVVRDVEAYPATVNGQHVRRGIMINNGLDVTLEGVTVAHSIYTDTSGATTFWGAGLYAKNVDLTLRDMTFHDNSIDASGTTDSYVYGGGVFVEGGQLDVADSTFQGNYLRSKVSSLGAGLAISHSQAATVTNCLFDQNNAWHGGGLYFTGEFDNSPLLLRDSTFTGNGRGYASAVETAHGGPIYLRGNIFQNNDGNNRGAISIYSARVTLEGNTLVGNKSGRTSAIYINSSRPCTLTNNLIAENESTYTWDPSPAVEIIGSSNALLIHNTIARNGSPYGVHVRAGATVSLYNTLLVSHTVGISVTSGTTVIMQGTLWGNSVWANESEWGGDGTLTSLAPDIHGNPAFVSPSSGNYHIRINSEAEGAGVDMDVSIDIDGEHRPSPDGTQPDIGADETGHLLIHLPLVMRDF